MPETTPHPSSPDPVAARLDSISLAARGFSHDLGNLMLPNVQGLAEIAESPSLTDRQQRLCRLTGAIFDEIAALRDAFEVLIDRPRTPPEEGLDLEAWWRRSVRILRPLIPGRPSIRSEFGPDLPRTAIAGPLLGRALLALWLDASDRGALDRELQFAASVSPEQAPDRPQGSERLIVTISGFTQTLAQESSGVRIASQILSAAGGALERGDGAVEILLPVWKPPL